MTVQTLGEGVPLEIEEDNTEKARKRPAVENLKRDQKPSKRSKPWTKDEIPPVKKIKLVRLSIEDAHESTFLTFIMSVNSLLLQEENESTS